jgi:hypothetical protein
MPLFSLRQVLRLFIYLVLPISLFAKFGSSGISLLPARTRDVMNHLAKEVIQGNVKSILFLTPCHATPYYSMLHHNLPMRFLDCTPRFGSNNIIEWPLILIEIKIS